MFQAGALSGLEESRGRGRAGAGRLHPPEPLPLKDPQGVRLSCRTVVLASGAGFLEDSFSMDPGWVGGWFGDDSDTLPSLCALFLLLLHQLRLRPSGIRSCRLGALLILKTYSINQQLLISYIQFSSVNQSCPTLCDPMNHSTSKGQNCIFNLKWKTLNFLIQPYML